MMTYPLSMVDPYPTHVVHVVLVRQDAPGLSDVLPRWRTLLDEDERVREARFYFEADRDRFAIGRALTRRLSHDIADRFFAPREVADLRALPAADQPRVFFDYWTLKEAYIKARGMGLALPLAHFAFTLRPPAAPTIAFDAEIQDDPDSWQFSQAWPSPDHRLGLAVRRGDAPDLELRYEDGLAGMPA
jgi:phosphopantetheinyl transferase (holo-ACP synthase)